MPKELISRFVKLCPTCRERRGTNCAADDDNGQLDSSSAVSKSPQAQGKPSRKHCRGEIISASNDPTGSEMPPQLINASPTFQNQNRWLSGFPQLRLSYEDNYPSPTAFVGHTNFRGLDHADTPRHPHFPTIEDASNEARSACGSLSQLK